MTTLQATMRPIVKPSTIIALHASGGSGAQWKVLAQRARHDFHVVAPDLYGHGIARAWAGAPANIVAADAERVGRHAAEAIGPVHLVGHSYGGAIALRVALEHPERVASVAVYEPVPLRILFDYNRKHRAASEVAEIADNIRRALIGGNAWRAAERFVDYWVGRPQWARLAPEKQATIAKRMPVILSHFVSLRRDAIRLRDYANLRIPVLYLSGRDTRASARRMSELLSSTLPDIEREILSDMGHLGPITHAEIVAQRIARFVYGHAEGWPMQERKAA